MEEEKNSNTLNDEGAHEEKNGNKDDNEIADAAVVSAVSANQDDDNEMKQPSSSASNKASSGLGMMGPGAFAMTAASDEEEEDEFDGDDLSEDETGLVNELFRKSGTKLAAASSAMIPNSRQLASAPKAPGDESAAAVFQRRRRSSKAESIKSGPSKKSANADVENQQGQQQQQQDREPQEAMIEAEIAPNIDEVVEDAVRKAVQEALKEKEQEGSSDALATTRTSHYSNGVPREVILAEKMDDEFQSSKICGLPKVWFFILLLLVVTGIVVAILFVAGVFASTAAALPEDKIAATTAPSDPYNEFMGIMELLYPGLPFENVTDGQYSAARWIVESDPRNLDTSTLNQELVERFALATVYFATSGEYWTDSAASHKWLSNLQHCSWDFVECNEQESVVLLKLRSQNLAGTLPMDIQLLTSLTSLDLARNDLDGSSLFTELFSLTHLKNLNIQRSKFSGSIPTEIGQLTALETLRLGWNVLDGSVPTEFGNLSNLSYIEAQLNRLSGTVPTELGQLTLLTTLRLRLNELTGALPSELGLLTQMTDFSFMGNGFSSTVPASFSNWKNITKFYIQENDLTGGLDGGLFCNFTSIQIFKADCYLNCTCCTECA